jgi:hypothetical protein
MFKIKMCQEIDYAPEGITLFTLQHIYARGLILEARISTVESTAKNGRKRNYVPTSNESTGS